jgi:hypothetical protein
MTQATTMIVPSTCCYNFYLDLIERERGTGIGEPFSLSDSAASPAGRNLVVRVTSIAHAAIQMVIAALETLPVLAVSTVLVLFNSANTGFISFDGGRAERIKVTALSALASAWFPVAASIWIAINPDVLASNEIASLPGIAQARLLSFTLPSLPKLDDHLGWETRKRMEERVSGHVVALSDGTGRSVDLLELADTRFFQWRERLATKLADYSKDSPTYFNGRFNLSSDEFRQDLLAVILP